ncbi:9925_t:CDS:2 [Paraglomus brasilianum]|uniref:Profilin n=1 Tax=Paraglomus brasilianum TaxID=144538 RepID=A0A9N8Z0U7_9GLOM|nr:9925_t:CDS:2 [Paraglomus brasilianum]
MSWQGYVDNNLLGTGKISDAAIYGHDGSAWATSPGFSVKPVEFRALFDGFKDDNSPLFGSGIRVNAVKYFTLKADARSCYGKLGDDGIIAVKTNQAILIGTYKDPIKPGPATLVVENLADYLIGVGYVSNNFDRLLSA